MPSMVNNGHMAYTLAPRKRGPLKAVLPVAGLGTRFLPATKALPKEMLPVVDKPAIQYVVEEAVGAGLRDILMVTGRNKTPLENHFDRVPIVENLLLQKGDFARLDAVNHASNLADIHYVRQGNPLGLGHAVLRGWQHVGDEPFAVLLGDDIIGEGENLLPRMIEQQQKRNATIIALMEVDPRHTSMYGVAAVEPTDEEDIVRVTGLVEKPEPGTAPSNLAVIGRYVLQPQIFPILEHIPPGRGNEIQLTDGLQILASDASIAGGVYGVVFRGKRYDTGDRLDYLKAVVQIASQHKDLGPDFTTWLTSYVRDL